MQLTDEQQKAMATHVRYEIVEFRNSIQSLVILKEAGRRNSAWNRALESTLLHFRNLRAFFYGEGNHPKSDVFAAHYVSSWNAKSGEDDPVFKVTHRPINQMLSHLTVERIDALSEWPLEEVNAAIEKLILRFKESLSAAQAVWFQLDEPAVQITLGHEGNSTVSGQVAPIIDTTTL